MLRRHLAVLGTVFGLLAISATSALAGNYYNKATVSETCSSYTITVTLTNLPVGDQYSFAWTITGLGTSTITGSHSFTATANTQTFSFTEPIVPGAGTFTPSGNVIAQGPDYYENIPIRFMPTTLMCQAPVCEIPPSGTAIPGAPVSWNGFTAPAGSVVWINAHIQSPSNVPTNTTTTLYFTGVTLVVNTTSYALPSGEIVFMPGVSTPTTVVNSDGSWTTTVSPTTSGDIFIVGGAIPVDSNLENGGHGNTNSTLSFTTSSNDSTLDFQWQWGAAVYTSWPGNAAADIEPVQANGLQPGAPQNPAVQQDLIQGPRGGGGSNFTGSWSGTGQGTCPN
jgi:hypothetical protein